MKGKALPIVFILLATAAQSQTRFHRNDIYMEAFGAGLFGSVNYERQLSKMPGMGIRLGLGFYTENKFYLTIPVGLNYLFPLTKRGSFIDAGIAYTPAFGDGRVFADKEMRDKFNSIIPSIGYRKHTLNNLMIRASFTPVINYSGFHPLLGLSLGNRF
jgi:hypothetical protein